MKKFIQLFVLAALVTTLAVTALAQTPTTTTTTPAAASQDDAEAKNALYKKFTENLKTNPAAAYEAGKEYLAKYEAKDGAGDQYIKYIANWIVKYDKAARRQLLIQQLIEKKYNEAFAGARTVLTDNPEDVEVLYKLVGGGYSAVEAKNEANNADAATYAKKLMQLIQAGKSPDASKTKDELLGGLNYVIGVFLRNSQPAEAAAALVTAGQIEGPSKKNQNTYLYLAEIYEKAEYAKLAEQLKASCKTDEQLKSQECIDLTAKVNSVVDHMIDALARAIAYSNSGPNAASFASLRAAWMDQLTQYYKYRNNNSDTGLKELIASITSRPLPKPGEPVVPPIVPQTPPATTPSSSASPTQPNGTTAGTTAGKTPSTPAANTTPPKSTVTKTTPKRAHN